jgi:hypothetical protein
VCQCSNELMLILGGVWRRSREKKRGKSLDWVLCDLLTDKYPPNVHYLVFFIIIVEVILPNHPFNLVVYVPPMEAFGFPFV